jgi:hypothetical protein
MAFVSLGGRRVRIAWLFVIVVVVGLMLVPYAAYGRGGPPDHARGRPPLSPPVGPPTHARAAAEHARGQQFVTVDAADPVVASVHRGTSRRTPKATGRT